MHRQIDKRLDDKNLKLRLALRAAQIGIWDWIVDTNEMHYSPRARAIYGFSPDEPVTYEKVRDATHPEDLPRTSALARRALDPAIRNKDSYEYRIRRADTGEVRWVVAHGEAIFLPVDGITKAVRYLGTLEDITDRKATELALRESELRQRLALDAARMAVWQVELATETITASPELNRMFGLPLEAKPTLAELRALYGPGEREKVYEIGRAALENGRSDFEAEFRCRRPDGSLYWLLLRAEMVFNSSGQIDRVIGVLMDINERKRSEDRQFLLMRELNHRVKNSLSVIQSIAMQSFRGDRADPAAVEDFRNRLIALAKANDVLLAKDWSAFSLRSLVEEIVAPYRNPIERIEIPNDDLDLPPRLNVPMALVLHELCTNSAKYGALSGSGGGVTIAWQSFASGIHMHWSERGGPPIIGVLRKGFGLKLITEVLSVELGEVTVSTDENCLRCDLRISYLN
jgi:PAS domain S-box-containing protein